MYVWLHTHLTRIYMMMIIANNKTTNQFYTWLILFIKLPAGLLSICCCCLFFSHTLCIYLHNDCVYIYIVHILFRLYSSRKQRTQMTAVSTVIFKNRYKDSYKISKSYWTFKQRQSKCCELFSLNDDKKCQQLQNRLI